ncbi:DUF4435 domain-containing protein [Vitreoscilla massiliensis]|uniref:DUF4435 domain-containing protein n=1 Tax=Vitreoscilla massiliensis TaxID=1689272 RepID=A0ABY4E6N0_9NEIS|nr:DUF4435 domain-containing protein [Vitreoscilla massiliensis]UOO91040.1 DUF4435 domain-containing protein [Vitreoscilla massiliensis]
MINSSIPTLSNRASNNLPYLYADLQDISIFVEDTAGETKAFYTKLMRKLVPNIKIHSIFTLGSKKCVIKSAENTQDITNRLYIIDGDLDLFHGSKVTVNGLFRSSVYCVENYICSEQSLAALIEESSGKVIFEEALEILCWDEFVGSITLAFEEIFILYAIAHRLNKILVRCDRVNEQIKTISRFKNETWINHQSQYKSPNISVIQQEIIQLETEILQFIEIEKLVRWKTEISIKLNDLSPDEKMDFISGKNYIIPFIRNYLIYKDVPAIRSVPLESLKYRLLAASNHPKLNELQYALNKVVTEGQYIHNLP